jgi:hypothetical protein
MTRANTTHPKTGGEHEDALEHGMPHDTHSKGAGTADAGVGVKPSGHATSLEHGNYPEPGEGATGGGAHNHRGLPPPSADGAVGGRGTEVAKGVIGGGRGLSGKFRGTMGDGQKGEPKGKGYMGC